MSSSSIGNIVGNISSIEEVVFISSGVVVGIPSSDVTAVDVVAIVIAIVVGVACTSGLVENKRMDNIKWCCVLMKNHKHNTLSKRSVLASILAQC